MKIKSTMQTGISREFRKANKPVLLTDKNAPKFSRKNKEQNADRRSKPIRKSRISKTQEEDPEKEMKRLEKEFRDYEKFRASFSFETEEEEADDDEETSE